MDLQATRRNVLKNSAWVVPAITIASTAPAMAASSSTPITFLGDAEALQPAGGYKTNVDQSYSAPLYINAPDGVGVETNPDGTAVTLTDITVQFYFPQSGLTFDNDYPDNGWGDLVADGSTIVNSGTTLYGYTGTYSPTGDLSANGDSVTMPFTTQFAWFVSKGTDVNFGTGTAFVYNVSLQANGVRHAGTGTGTTTDSTSGAPVTVEFQ